VVIIKIPLGGKEVVTALLKDYREVYKRERNMMKKLKSV
jgi:hypothetical protein